MITPSDTPPFQVLFVSDIDHISQEEDLWRVFAPWSTRIRSICLIRDPSRAASIAHAYVNFDNNADALQAYNSVVPLFLGSSYCRVVPYDGQTLLKPLRIDQSGGSGIFIKNLDPNIGAATLWGYFMGFGHILGCRIAVDDFGVSRRFAYVTYDTPEEAHAAINAMDGQLIGQRQIQVTINKPKSDRDVRLFIRINDASSGENSDPLDENPPRHTIEESQIREYLEKYGKVTNVDIPVNNQGKRRGFAIVSFADIAVAKTVIAEVTEIAGVPVQPKFTTGAPYSSLNNPVAYSNPKHRGNSHKTNSGHRYTPDIDRSYDSDHSSFDESRSVYSPPGDAELNVQNPHAKPKFRQDSFRGGPRSRQTSFPDASADYISSSAGSTYSNRSDDSHGRIPLHQTNLFIRPINNGVTEEDLNEEFKKYGSVVYAKLMTDENGNSKGYGFISYEQPAEATNAIAALNGEVRWGNQLFVAPAHNRCRSSVRSDGMMQSPPMTFMRHANPGMITEYAVPAAAPGPSFPLLAMYYVPYDYGYEYPGYNHTGSAGSMASSGVDNTELGEVLFARVLKHPLVDEKQDLAGWVTGLLLQQKQSDIISWLYNENLLNLRIEQAYDAFQKTQPKSD